MEEQQQFISQRIDWFHCNESGKVISINLHWVREVDWDVDGKTIIKQRLFSKLQEPEVSLNKRRTDLLLQGLCNSLMISRNFFNQGAFEMLTKREYARKYLEAIQTQIEFKQGVPVDFDLYIGKINKLAAGIEYCWNDFSDESRQFFIDTAYKFTFQAEKKFSGFHSVYLRFILLIPSLICQKNLYSTYKDSFLIIPRAVIRAIDKCSN